MRTMMVMVMVMAVMMLAGCKSSPTIEMGKDPAIDGSEMIYKSLCALKDGDSEKANDVIGEYMAYYADKSPKEISAFCMGASQDYWAEMYENPTSKWLNQINKLRPMMAWYVRSDVPLTSLPNYGRLREWYNKYTAAPDYDD